MTAMAVSRGWDGSGAWAGVRVSNAIHSTIVTYINIILTTE